MTTKSCDFAARERANDEIVCLKGWVEYGGCSQCGYRTTWLNAQLGNSCGSKPHFTREVSEALLSELLAAGASLCASVTEKDASGNVMPVYSVLWPSHATHSEQTKGYDLVVVVALAWISAKHLGRL